MTLDFLAVVIAYFVMMYYAISTASRADIASFVGRITVVFFAIVVSHNSDSSAVEASVTIVGLCLLLRLRKQIMKSGGEEP